MVRKMLALLLAAALLLSLGACSKEEVPSSSEPESQSQPVDPNYPVTVGDVEIAQRPEAVVSLSPALTEWIFAMGYGDQLTGVSDYCDKPEDSLEGLPRCGTPQSVNFEALAQADPQLVVASASLGDKDKAQLEEQGIPVVVVERAPDMAALREAYVDLARALEGDEAGAQTGAAFFDDLDARLEALERRGKEHIEAKGAKTTVIMLRIADFVMATGDTFEHTLLDTMGFENLAAPYGEWVYPKEKIKELIPNLIISDSSITIPDLEKNATYKGGQATIHDQVVNVDFTAFERQSPRMLDELEKVADFAYPAPAAATT